MVNYRKLSNQKHKIKIHDWKKLNNLHFEISFFDYEEPFFDNLHCDVKDCIYNDNDNSDKPWCEIENEVTNENLKNNETNKMNITIQDGIAYCLNYKSKSDYNGTKK